MNVTERINNWKIYPSIRGQFGFDLYKQMALNANIFLVIADLGYALFDAHREDFPDRCINTGAAESSAMGIATGLALVGRTPCVYTITSFYLRAAEAIGLYLHGEQIPVKLIGSGMDDDYKHDGPSHHGGLAQAFLDNGPRGTLNIENYYPSTREEVPIMLDKLIKSDKPGFLCLKR
jgi:transketolase